MFTFDDNEGADDTCNENNNEKKHCLNLTQSIFLINTSQGVW